MFYQKIKVLFLPLSPTLQNIFQIAVKPENDMI